MNNKLEVEVDDRPDLLNKIVTAIADKGFSIGDINYNVLDTDSGRARFVVNVDPASIPNQKLILSEIEHSLIKDCGRKSPYERWFRRPTLRLTVVTGDRIGLVRDLVQHTVLALDRSRNTSSGNILDLKGFPITDEGLYAIQMQVATTSIFHQARLVSCFNNFCSLHQVLSYDVAFENFLYEYCQEAQSDAS